MNQIFERIMGLTTILRKHSPIQEPFLQQLNKKFRLEFNYNSTHIEGEHA